MNGSISSEQMATLFGDLEPFEGVERTELDQASSAVATSLSAARPEFLAFRRELPISTTALPGGLPTAAAGSSPSRTFGPFRNKLGRRVWIDLIPIIQNNFKLVRAAGAPPFLILPIRALIPIGSQFGLGAGSVWFASTQLAPGAPSGGYTGLKIQSGTVTFSQPIQSSANLEILVPPDITCTIALQLDAGTAPAGSGPGEDARESITSPPKTVTMLFDASGATIQAVDSARMEVYGSAVDLQVRTTTPRYISLIDRIFVDASVSQFEFAVTGPKSDLFQPDGSAAIESGGWTLPVAVVSPDLLGDASGAGGLALGLDDGLRAAWKGQDAATPLSSTILMADVGQITLVTFQSRGLNPRQTVQLWSTSPGEPPSSRVDLLWPGPFTARFVSSSSGAEALVLSATMSANLDRPVTVAGNRVKLNSRQTQVTLTEAPGITDILIEAIFDRAPSPQDDIAFAIENAVFRVSQASSLKLTGINFDGLRAQQGQVQIEFTLQFLMPILPDPYAANFAIPPPGGDPTTATILASTIIWSPATTPPFLTFAVPFAPQPAARQPTEATFPDLTLLDLSTNIDQFGVTLKVPVTGTIPPGPPLGVVGTLLTCGGTSLSVMTLPAVLWEPVFTEGDPSFSLPITFDQSGAPTRITVENEAPVGVTPGLALDNLVNNFNTQLGRSPATANITLPFGIVAIAELRRIDATNPRGALVDYNRPKFAAESVEGGYQVRIQAVDPNSPGAPGFPGSSTQLKIGRSGALTGLSVLDDGGLDQIFNSYLGPAGKNPQVPVTRIDISGYGESLFSDWRNPTDLPAEVSQARFDVIVGRAAFEVVQFRSILYPYGVRVVRTVTISRKNSAAFVRRDSGWQAATDGQYDFPGNVLTTHAGVIHRIVNVRNIRDTGHIVDSGGARVAGVRFDGELDIEHVVSGPGLVPARDQLGYVQLTSVSSGSLTQAQYQSLIEQAGPLGGPVDCTINVGGSGQLMKLGRVGVGVTITPGAREFVMAAWGSPQFAQGGEWFFLRQTGAGSAPELIDKQLGVPLIRVGPAQAPVPTAPYRFADPEDLARPDSPASDYGIVHATGTQRVFFPRPQIEAASPDRITSTQTPVLADPFSLAIAVGPFPRTDSAITFPDNNYALAFSGGNYRLLMPSPSFPVTVGQRTFVQAGSVRIFADYSGSTASYSVDTGAAVRWQFELKDVALVTSTSGFGEISRLTSTVHASDGEITRLTDPILALGDSFGLLRDIFPFLKRLPLPGPIEISMTNEFQARCGFDLPLDQIIEGISGGELKGVDLDLKGLILLEPEKYEIDVEFEGAIEIPIQLFKSPFAKVVVYFDLAAKLHTEIQRGTETQPQGAAVFEFTLGGGIGTSGEIPGLLKLQAFVVVIAFIVTQKGGNVFGLGGGVLGKFELEVGHGFFGIEFSVEGKLAYFKVECPEVTIFGVAQLTIALEITVAFVFDVDLQIQLELDGRWNSGPCALPDVL